MNSRSGSRTWVVFLIGGLALWTVCAYFAGLSLERSDQLAGVLSGVTALVGLPSTIHSARARRAGMRPQSRSTAPVAAFAAAVVLLIGGALLFYRVVAPTIGINEPARLTLIEGTWRSSMFSGVFLKVRPNRTVESNVAILSFACSGQAASPARFSYVFVLECAGSRADFSATLSDDRKALLLQAAGRAYELRRPWAGSS